MEAKLAPGDGYKYLLLPPLFLLLSRCPDMIPMDLNRVAPNRSNRMSSHPTRCFLQRNVTVPKWKSPETYISALAQRSSCTIDDDECNSTSKSQSPLQEFFSNHIHHLRVAQPPKRVTSSVPTRPPKKYKSHAYPTPSSSVFVVSSLGGMGGFDC